MTTMWDQNAEAMSTDERASQQSKRLGALVRRLGETSPFYRRRLAESGVSPDAEVGLDDLASLPFTLKSDLWDNYPWGMLTVPRDRVVRVHASSGTGGRPTLVGYSRGDLAMWAEMNGCTVIPASSGQSARQVRLMRDLGAEILLCTPSYAARLGEVVVEEGIDPAELSLRAGLFGAEPWSDAMRRQIEAMLGLKALDIYGLSEVIGPGVSAECVEAQAGLHVNEDHFLVEVIDPSSGLPLPPGQRGELVFTTLTREAQPVLRYRSGDVASLDPTPCACGRTLARMSKVYGRIDDMLVIRGVNVYPSEVEAVLVGEPAVGPNYLLVVDRSETMPKLVVACELTAARDGDAERAHAKGTIANALLQRLGLSTEVRVLPVGTIPRIEMGKAKRVAERTPDNDPLSGLVKLG